MGTTVDWNRWLPPRRIRDRGDLEFKVGQVWAWRYDDDSIVFRVLQYGCGKDASVRVDGLARLKFNGEPPIAMRAAGCCVLVQDVGQPEPTPPDNLWQEAYALPPDMMKTMDAIKVRDAETKKRYDDIVMSGFTALSPPAVIPYVDRPPMRATIPDYGASGYRYQTMLDDRPRSHASTKPVPKSEKEIYQLQKLNDGDRKRVELFPERPARPICAGARMTADHFGAFVVRGEPKPPSYVYPEISEDDLLPDA